MTKFLRSAALLLAVPLTLAACDPAEFDPDPDVRAEARSNRKCVAAVKKQTGSATASVNTTIPVVEFNQFLIDVPKATWVCIADDEGNPKQLYELGKG